ncbi:bifunctional protein-serine/threonine kinase/phosphatase [Sphingomonas solaris]|uniref:Bifunctional protein-serine/threonine kinase/phosphatase n=1 Tax=Alterirhizorhabdus solaris TaxID=2529389 RepID=A0A558R6W0_9SPHN|nr:bifunctional protein-serine/threonine kinase/phosphatase [Sphingomonas solaris]TVV75114.1 bifunctional protein-serine/threonine kinase/phosphatase [Sphingomonas solaris]
MHGDGKLEIAAGFASARGPRPDNQDFGGVDLGSETDRAVRGIVAAVADGVGGAKAGRAAAELAVRSFIDGYRAANPVSGIAAGGLMAMRGYNRWLHERGRIDPGMTGAATTFTALVLRGREAVALHLGDSRAWHFRDGVLTRLTDDHVLPQPDLNHVLYRAVGIEADVRLDVRAQSIEPHDRLLIASDGVHGVLSDRVLARLLGARASAQTDADAIVAAAGAANTRDNATAIVIDILGVTAIDQDIVGAEVARLPILPPPKAGDVVDGFALDRLLSDGRYTRLFVGRDATGEVPGDIVVKFPKPALLSEAGARAGFLREGFLGRRIDNPHVGRTLPVPGDRQSRLYTVMPHHEGETLEQRLLRVPPSIARGVVLATGVARGVAALHRLGVAHRDIKPENVIVGVGDRTRLIDLGVARLAALAEFAESETPGTPSYMAPEMFDGEAGNPATDQYALGVTIYRLFTGRYPYGEVEAFSHPRFGAPVSPARYRPDMPAWLEAVILRAVAVDPAQRFGDVEELIHRLEAGSTRAVPHRVRPPLMESHPVRVWQVVSLILAIALLVSLAHR